MPAADAPRLLEVGRIDKAHGVRGDVVVRLTSDRLERLAVGSRLQTDDGELVVESARPHQDRWIVHFEDVYGPRDSGCTS
jgi:16S rRNA processing protein RimM